MFFVELQQIAIALGVIKPVLLTYFACDRKSESKSMVVEMVQNSTF